MKLCFNQMNVFLDLNILSVSIILICVYSTWLIFFFFYVGWGEIQNNRAYSASVYKFFFPFGMCVYISGRFKVILTVGS